MRLEDIIALLFSYENVCIYTWKGSQMVDLHNGKIGDISEEIIMNYDVNYISTNYDGILTMSVEKHHNKSCIKG